MMPRYSNVPESPPRFVHHFLVPVVAACGSVIGFQLLGFITPTVGAVVGLILGMLIGWIFSRRVQTWLATPPQDQVTQQPCPHCHGPVRLDTTVRREETGKAFVGIVTCSQCGLHLKIELAAPLAMPIMQVRDGGLRLMAERWSNAKFRRELAAEWRKKQSA